MYKDEKQMATEIKKEQDESLKQVKKVVYPFWTVALLVNGCLLVGYYYQEKAIARGQKMID